MALFGLGKKKEPVVSAPTRDEATVSAIGSIELIQADSFRGCKRFSVRPTTYNKPVIEKNLDYLKSLGYDFKGKQISLLLGTHSELGECILVHVGGLHIGNIFYNDKYAEMFNAVRNKTVNKAHLLVDDTEHGIAIYLYLRW